MGLGRADLLEFKLKTFCFKNSMPFITETNKQKPG
jgi:hypothetical protein